MPEELTAPTTSEAAATTGTPASEKPTGVLDTQAAVAATPQAGSDWALAIETVDPSELRKHPRVAGIVGDLLNKEKTRWQQEQESRITLSKREEAEANLRQLAEDDPVEFSRQYLTQAQQAKIQKDLQGLRGQTQQEMAAQIRQSVETLPEYKELAEADVLDIARAMAGKGDHEVLGLFATALVDKVSGKRAAKLFADRWDKEIAKEREAIRAEEAAKLLKREKGPDMTRPAGAPVKADLSNIKDDTEFNKRYDEEILNRRVMSRYRSS